MSNVANILEDHQFVEDVHRLYLYLSQRYLRDEFQKTVMKDRSSAAQPYTYEIKNPSWIGLLKDKILAS